MTIKKYVLFLAVLGISGILHADSIKHGGVSSSLSDTTISSLTVTNQATFNGSSVTITGDFLLDQSTMLTNGTLVISTAPSASAATANVFISTMGTVMLKDFSGDTIPNLTLITPAVSGARWINFRTAEDTDRFSIGDFGSNGLHMRGGAFGLKDSSGNEGIQMTFASSLNTFEVDNSAGTEMFGIDVLGVIRTSQNSSCTTLTPVAIGHLCVKNSATCPISVATGTAVAQWACMSLSATQGP